MSSDMKNCKYLKKSDNNEFCDVYTQADRIKDAELLSDLYKKSKKDFIKECDKRWDNFFKNPSLRNYSKYATAMSVAKYYKIDFVYSGFSGNEKPSEDSYGMQ